MSNLIQVFREETFGIHWRYLFARILLAPFPDHTGGRLRVTIFRSLGFNIGMGTMFWGSPKMIGGSDMHKNLKIGNNCLFAIRVFLDLAGSISMDDFVNVGPETMMITGSHEIAGRENRLGRLDPRPIRIGRGVWLGARCTILPGVSIGSGAVVGAGALVVRDVPPDTIVAGVPAKVIKKLEN